MNIFKILIVDDNLVVKSRLEKELSNRKITFNGNEWTLNIKSIHVGLEEKGGHYSVTKKTLECINEACSESFDLILMDYGYITEKGYNTYKERLQEEKGDFTVQIMDGILLSPTDIAVGIRQGRYRKALKNMVGHTGDVIIYTYTPHEHKRFYPSTDIRENVSNEVYQSARSVKVINTSEELFNDAEFHEKHSDNYYSFIVSKFLLKEITIKIAKKVIDQEQSLRKKNAINLFSSIAVLSGFVGVFNELAGGLIFRFGLAGQHHYAIAGTLVTIILVVIGVRSVKFLLKNKFN